ncbi:MAG: Gfo/Idh/MocA family oxidoreductase [Dehalococcoidia bacterium]
MPDRIGVGIIGANVNYGWGTRAHLPALQALPEFDLVGVATTQMATARETADRYGIANAFDDAAALAAHPEVDLVVVCVRVPGHYALVKTALEAGKHVFCEWPLGANTAEAAELRDLATARGVRNMVGLQARGAPAFIRLRELVRDGYIGDVLSADMYSALPGAGPRRESFAWAVDRAKGASTLSIASGHSLDALAFCLGEFAEVSAVVSTRVQRVPLEGSDQMLDVTAPDHVLLSGMLEGGALVSAAIKSVPAVGTGFRFEVQGSEGTLRVTSSGGAQMGDLVLGGAKRGERALETIPLEVTDRWVPETLNGPPLNVAQLFRRLGNAINGGGPAHPDFDHAVRRHRFLDALEEASASGQRVRVDLG